MQVVLAGGFAFDFLDRLTGGTLNVDPPAWAIKIVFQIFIDPPLVFFIVNIVWLCTFCYALVRLMQYLVNATEGVFTMRVRVNKKIKSEDGLHAFLGTKVIESIDIVIHPVCISIDRSIDLCIYLSVCLSVCLSIYLSICLSIYLTIYLSI